MTPAKPTNEPKGTGRYEPLTAYLKGQDASSVTVTFDQLAEILGFRLPAAASNHAEWWQEGSSHPQARGWRDAGWTFVRTDRRAQTVTFRKDEPTARRKAAGSAARAKPRATAGQGGARRTPAKSAGFSPKKGLTSGLILIPGQRSDAARRRPHLAPADDRAGPVGRCRRRARRSTQGARRAGR